MLSASAKGDVDEDELPTAISELSETASHTYDLSITRAAELNIPVVGSGTGSLKRRVVVHEWKKFKPIMDKTGIRKHVGLVIRFAVTVDNWEVSANFGLPFLSAKAQLGQIKASWRMQVRGLAGPNIDKHILPPGELNVETFVLGKQNLEKIVESIDDDSTTFHAVVIESFDPRSKDLEYWIGAVKAFAVFSIRKKRAESDALRRLSSNDQQAIDAVSDVYESFGIGANQRPDDDAVRKASAVLRNLSVSS